ncbi:MAG: DUF6607 family protein [Pseudomonadota bacterium]
MLKSTKTLLACGLAALAVAALPVATLADDPVARAETAAASAFEEDRATILAMAGNHTVVFDMQESTPWIADYTPVDKKVSGGYETVVVAEDTGTKIVLQHLLVVGPREQPYVVKHWRQDWEYQPAQMLTFDGGDSWTLTDIPEAERAGGWSQTVYQVDDSPRYAGFGHWKVHNGIKEWVSNETARPLARRDAVRNPIYKQYLGINRHALTPKGWIHWQDNTKMMPAKDGSGAMVPVVQEYVLNTYERFDDYNVAAAETYWAKTKDYWAAIRAKWDAVLAEQGGIRIAQNPEVGTTIAGELLMMADAIKKGETSSQEATDKALALIAQGTQRKGG